MTVLRYLQNVSTRFKVFVAHRMQQLQGLFDVNAWNYVLSEKNPADLASRGFNPDDKEKRKFWLKGPAFLRDSFRYFRLFEEPTAVSFCRPRRCDHPLPESSPSQEIRLLANEVQSVSKTFHIKVTHSLNSDSFLVALHWFFARHKSHNRSSQTMAQILLRQTRSCWTKFRKSTARSERRDASTGDWLELYSSARTPHGTILGSHGAIRQRGSSISCGQQTAYRWRVGVFPLRSGEDSSRQTPDKNGIRSTGQHAADAKLFAFAAQE